MDELELGAYIDGALSSGRKEAMERHLSECRHCWDEFVNINRMIMGTGPADGEDVPEHLIQKAVRLLPGKGGTADVILALLKKSVRVIYSAGEFALPAPPVPAGLRSGNIPEPEMIVLEKSFDGLKVRLYVEKTADRECSIQVAVHDPVQKAVMSSHRVELLSNNRVIASLPLEEGAAVLEYIGSGTYTIRILAKEKLMGETSLKIT